MANEFSWISKVNVQDIRHDGTKQTEIFQNLSSTPLEKLSFTPLEKKYARKFQDILNIKKQLRRIEKLRKNLSLKSIDIIKFCRFNCIFFFSEYIFEKPGNVDTL